MSERVIVGRISGLYGIQGWVKVISYTDPIDNILTYTPWQLGQRGEWHHVELSAGHAHSKGIIVQLTGYTDRTLATQLLGAEIAVSREQLPILSADNYYWSELIGLTVINQAGIQLGTVESLLETGANDVLVVTGERERLIPYLFGTVVLEVNLTQRWLRVDWDAEF